jgi:hypothetical protein
MDKVDTGISKVTIKICCGERTVIPVFQGNRKYAGGKSFGAKAEEGRRERP